MSETKWMELSELPDYLQGTMRNTLEEKINCVVKLFELIPAYNRKPKNQTFVRQEYRETYLNDGSTLTPGIVYNVFLVCNLRETAVETWELWHGAVREAVIFSWEIQVRDFDARVKLQTADCSIADANQVERLTYTCDSDLALSVGQMTVLLQKITQILETQKLSALIKAAFPKLN